MIANSQGTSVNNGGSTGGGSANGKNATDVRDSCPAGIVAMCGSAMPRYPL